MVQPLQDADHYGLEKIKRRLIEYLAVLRLKTIQAAKETEPIACKSSVRWRPPSVLLILVLARFEAAGGSKSSPAVSHRGPILL